ncbi:MAG: class I adenylate-forming enzyme family protein [Gemmatimonadota bacterium]
MTVPSLLDRLQERAGESADAPAIIECGGWTITRDALARQVRATAAGLADVGMQHGDRVLFAVRSSANAIVLAVAILELGAVLVPLDTGLGESLFAERMALIAPTWIVADSLLLAASGIRAARWFLRMRGIRMPPLAALQGATFVRVGKWMPGAPRSLSLRAVCSRGARTAIPPSTLGSSDPAIIVCTSGTTGAPNAVVHTRQSTAAVLGAVGVPLALGPTDVVHTRELHMVFPTLLAGATVLLSRRSTFSAPRVLAELERYAATCWVGVTSDCHRLAEYSRVHDTRFPPALRQVVISSAPVRAPFLHRLREVLAPDTQVWCVYGLTELGPAAVIDLEEKLAYTGEGDLVGRPVPGVEARLSTEGELLLRGPNLCGGYLGHAPLNELATGDLARIADGRIVLLGRRKDMIIRGSHNIYPELYEPAIERIAGIRCCAMVGVYDDALADERIVLGVEPEPGVDADELRERVHAGLRNGSSRIDDAALPDLIVVETLPVCGRSSKVNRQRLRELARQRLECASR